MFPLSYTKHVKDYLKRKKKSKYVATAGHSQHGCLLLRSRRIREDNVQNRVLVLDKDVGSGFQSASFLRTGTYIRAVS